MAMLLNGFWALCLLSVLVGDHLLLRDIELYVITFIVCICCYNRFHGNDVL
jgi:hypothetical protein